MTKVHKATMPKPCIDDPRREAAQKAFQERNSKFFLPIDPAHMQEYVYCWRVQYAYKCTDMQLNRLLDALAATDGAIKECPAWKHVNAKPSHPLVGDSFIAIHRSSMLYEALLQHAIDENNRLLNKQHNHIFIRLPYQGTALEQSANVKNDNNGIVKVTIPSSKVLHLVIQQTYEEEKPEKKAILDMLKKCLRGDIESDSDVDECEGEEEDNDDYVEDEISKNRSIFRNHLDKLYIESLLLKREDVREYCRNNQIPQIRKTPGLMLEDRATAALSPQPLLAEKVLQDKQKSDNSQPEERIPANVLKEYQDFLSGIDERNAHNKVLIRRISAYLLAAQDKSDSEISTQTGYATSSLSHHINEGHEKAIEHGLPSLWDYMPDRRMIRRRERGKNV